MLIAVQVMVASASNYTFAKTAPVIQIQKMCRLICEHIQEMESESVHH